MNNKVMYPLIISIFILVVSILVSKRKVGINFIIDKKDSKTALHLLSLKIGTGWSINNEGY